MPRRRYGKPGDAMQLRAVLWQTIVDTKALTDVRLPAQPSAEIILKVAHALAQLAGPYARLLETCEIEARVAALEIALAERNNHHGTPY